jgi:nicotinamide-nucleotide amidase
VVFALPGVPSEMAVMLDEQVLPRLRRAAGEPAVLRSRTLRTWGLGESAVADALDDLFATANPSIAFLVDGVEVRVRISAKAADSRTASAMIAEVEREVAGRLGSAVFGRDGQTVQAVLARQLASRGWTVGVIEEVTHGAVTATLADAAPEVFDGGLVVPRGAGTTRDAVGGMLDRGISVLGSDVVLAIGGAVTEDGDDQARRVVMAVGTPEARRARTVHLLGDAPRIREYARGTALHLARLAVTGHWWPADRHD